jgi:altronate hydrolase
MDFIRLDRADAVVTATKNLAVGMKIGDITVRDVILSGHKVATQAMATGDPVRKYAQVIGYASCEILPGDHVHTHNVDFRNTDTDYEFSTDLRAVPRLPRKIISWGIDVKRLGWHAQLHCHRHLGQLFSNGRADDRRSFHG